MTENIQKKLYESIHDEYSRHHYHETSLEYRRKYLTRHLIGGNLLDGSRIADIACGSGWNTILMAEHLPNATFEGYDISQKACEDYTALTGYKAHCVDLTTMSFEGEPFDAAMVCGGLHHMMNDLHSAAKTLSKMIKPGGYLFTHDPNANFFLDRVRLFWYKKDRMFAENESSLSAEQLRQLFHQDFEMISTAFLGGPAYIFIYNSGIMRMPLWTKRPLFKPLMALEKLYNFLPGEAPFPLFIARWKRK